MWDFNPYNGLVMAYDRGWLDEFIPDWLSGGSITQVTVIRVVDGDTLVVNDGGNEARVRLIGIDTPEVGEVGSEEATAFTSALIHEVGMIVWLESVGTDRDRFGRLRRYVWLTNPNGLTDDQRADFLLNQRLLDSGYAVSWGDE